jgi:hypothetical protein
MDCANPKCRCGSFDMPDGQSGTCSWNCMAVTRPETARKHSQYPRCRRSIVGFVLAAAAGSFSGIGRHSGVVLAQRQPAVRYRNAQAMEGASTPFRFSVSCFSRSRRRISGSANPIPEGEVSCLNRPNSTLFLSSTMSSSLLQVLQRSCDITASMLDLSLIHSRLYRLRPQKPRSCSSPISRCRCSQGVNWQVKSWRTLPLARCSFFRRKGQTNNWVSMTVPKSVFRLSRCCDTRQNCRRG